MPLSGKERAARRREAHHLSPTVQVGQQGVTPALVRSLDEALRARELVKIQLWREGDEPPRAMARALADAVGADVVQVIGRTTTLYRKREESDEAHAR
ncbi:MAG TPA: YhbY family RNA-binding protein [Gemmatimonadaceae bacterium]|nr:YhbY family RNA-binding protein [Gemmatimonadaceae bacterium]